MAKHKTPILLILVMIGTSSAAAAAADGVTTNENLLAAVEEMQRANYFAFVMLLNISPLLDSRLLENVTFLMPSNRALSRINLRGGSVSDFLLRHSIPSPLLFEYLQRIPSNSSIPTSTPDYMLKISNNGRRSFYLNNVKITSPNICTAGSSIRCHGIDAVLPEATENNSTSSPSSTCAGLTPTSPSASPIGYTELPSSETPTHQSDNQAPTIAPQPSVPAPHKSASSPNLARGGTLLLNFLVATLNFVLLLVMSNFL